jgi:predicted DsbA family dithiol-disulfide isomerase
VGRANTVVGCYVPWKMTDKLQVQVWSDVACPWCWVGKRHLEAAIEQLGEPVEVTWRAFELDPTAPTSVPDDVDLVERLATKYGVARAGAQAMIDRMTGVGARSGIDFHFERAKPGNTFDAHRLLAWAAETGLQDALKERLFEAYMQEGRLVSDHEVLVELAADVGLDPERAQAVLSSNEHAVEVRREQAMAQQLGVSGVPFFVVGGRYGVAGAQPTEVLLDALTRARADARSTQLEVETGDGDAADACGPDGCAV